MCSMNYNLSEIIQLLKLNKQWEDQRTQETAAKTLRRLWDQWLNWQGPLLHTSVERLSAVIWRCLPYTDSQPCQQPPAHRKRCRVHPKMAIMSLNFVSIQLRSMGSKNLNMRVSKTMTKCIWNILSLCRIQNYYMALNVLSIRSIIIHLLCFYIIEMPSHKP